MIKSKLTIPVLFICGFKAGRTKETIGALDVLDQAFIYRDHGADALLIVECSSKDEEHEASIAAMKALVRSMDLPLYICGNVHRFEDIKKYLYTGAVKVFCNPEMKHEKLAFDEGVKRFGQEKVVLQNILASITYAEDTYVDLSQNAMAVPEVNFAWADMKTDSAGLVPAVVQDYRTGEVLMVGYMDEQAYNHTIETGCMTYYSRSRKEQWVKGETSGHFQFVKSLWLDCDNDTILAKVYQIGAACHTNNYSCFYRSILEKPVNTFNPHKVLEDVMAVIVDRKKNPKEGSYTNYLFDKGIDKILKKCGEEATEIVIAAKNPDPDEIIYEIADFLYHVSVLMAVKGVTWDDIMLELANRE